MLAALPCVGWSVHVGQKRDLINPQGVDDDMHMDIPAVVMPVRYDNAIDTDYTHSIGIQKGQI